MKKTVVVSGGFDPLHIGHIRYFNEARKLGDELVVILNSDNFLIEKKGYVFMPWSERREIIANLRSVDWVVDCIDKDQTVIKTLELLKPAIFAKGGDRMRENIPEVAVCERLGIKMVFGVGGKKVQSSSQLAEKMKNEKRAHKN